MALILIEDRQRHTRIDDLSAYCHVLAMEDEEFAKHYFAEHIGKQRVGIGCSSYSVTCSDADISLSVSGIANKIHEISITGAPLEAEIHYGIIMDNGMGIRWKSVKLGPTTSIDSSANTEMEIRVLDTVSKKMHLELTNYSPNETGGVVVGYISLPREIMYITSLIEAPKDSKRSPQYFELGTDGLSEEIDTLRYPLQALGTWHTHPKGGGPSSRDMKTKQKIESIVSKRLSCCLIVTKKGIIKF